MVGAPELCMSSPHPANQRAEQSREILSSFFMDILTYLELVIELNGTDIGIGFGAKIQALACGVGFGEVA